MLSGAIVGAVVGTAVAVVMLLRRTMNAKKFVAAWQRDRQAAHALLDQQIPPAKAIKLQQILDQRERMARLALLGDAASLAGEARQHTGTLTAIVQVGAAAWLGVALSDPARRREAVAELDALARRIEAEGSKLMGVVKKKTRALATLGLGLLGEPLPLDQEAAVFGLSQGEIGVYKAMVQAGLAEVLRLNGAPDRAARLDAEVRAALGAPFPIRR